jgi:hypothetical protein
MDLSPAGLRTENDCADEGHQQLQMTDPSSGRRDGFLANRSPVMGLTWTPRQKDRLAD